MSHKLSKKHRYAKKQMKRVIMRHTAIVFALLALIVIGLVSTTFASFASSNTANEGSLIADVLTAVVNRNNKNDIAQTNATVTFTSDDVLFFNMKAVSWWTAGTDGNGNFAYFFNDSVNPKTSAWSAHAVKYSGDIYYVKIPAGTWEGVILTRNNTSTAPNWDNKWNQTGNIALSSTSNYISSFSEGSTSVTWSTQKPTSNASLSASSANVSTGTAVTLTPSLTSNTTYNEIKSTSYSISPSTGGASISGNTFTATAGGTYTVTATVTYNPRGYSGLTSTATASTTITVADSGYSYTVSAGEGGTVTPSGTGKGTSVSIKATAETGYTFDKWIVSGSGSVANADSASTTFTITGNGATATASFTKNKYTYTVEAGEGGTVTPTGGDAYQIDGVEITATPNAGYKFDKWTVTNGDVDSTSSATTKLKPTANGAKATASFKRAFIGGTALYLEPNNNWKEANARFAAYFYNSSGATGWASATKHNTTETNCYVVTVPDGDWEHVIWVRMNGATTANNWDNDWNQTVNLDPGDYDKFTINEGQWGGNGNGATGTWSMHTVFYTVTFKDHNGTVLNTQQVEEGKTPTAPSDPSRTGYTFKEWTPALGAINEDTTYTATYTLNPPLTLTLTGSNVASGTSGNGTEANPYIIFSNGGFALTATAAIKSGPTGVYAVYSTTENGSYTTDNVFNPTPSSFGTKLSQTIYAKAYDGTLYSTSLNATAYYMAFHHLVGSNITFNNASEQITEIDSLTLSGAKINGIDSTENGFVDFTYQVSTSANGTYEDIDGTEWSPSAIGTYYFRVKAYNATTKETAYSTLTKTVVVKKSEVDLTVINEGTVNATVNVFADGALVSNKIPGNSDVTVSVARLNSDYYIQYIKINDTVISDYSNFNGDISEYLAVEQIKSALTIKYKIALKPTVAVSKHANAQSISFEYFVDGVKETVASASTYYVDYGKAITYTVTPVTGYYVKSMQNVEIDEMSSTSAKGTNNSVTSNLSVSAEIVANNTVTVNINDSSPVTEGASITFDDVAHSFGVPKALNYNVPSKVVITPPDGYYALINGGTISTDGKATLNVKVTGSNIIYTVRFVENPKIYMVQPQYGSVYVNDNDGNYYFNGDPVGYGTELTVNVKPDHANAVLSDVLVNDASIGTVDGLTFYIYEDSTATATITMSDDFAFAENEHTAYGTRRIFFTDTCAWGNSNPDNVLVHYSNTSGDTDFTKNNITMTRKYFNEYSQYVYYADIPFSTKYVTFVNAANTAQCSTQGIIAGTNNAYYMGNTGNYPRGVVAWVLNYSDYVATDRETTIQQAVTSKGEPVTFQYTCDFGDDTLSAEKVAGNEVTYDFDRGTLSITPTQNTYSYSLVKVTSAASTTVKYYLIKVENFEIYDFTGLQKIYNNNVLNSIQLDLIVKGGVLNYAARLFVSDTNAGDASFSQITDFANTTGFVKHDTLEAYINSFLINWQLNGVKYVKAEATDSANHKASACMKTLFGTNTYEGERALYFYNNTNVNIAKYNLRACFKNAGGDYVWATMQPVGNTNYYRAVIPTGYSAEVDFFLTSKKTFTYERDDIINTDGTLNTEFCSFGVVDVDVPDVDAANIVYAVNSIDTNGGINGQFAEFDY